MGSKPYHALGRPKQGEMDGSRVRRRKCLSGQEKRPADKGCQQVDQVGATGFERNSDASEPPTGQGFTPTLPAACTAAWTSEAENDNVGTVAGTAADADEGRNEGEGADEGDRLDKLVAALLTLSPSERERLPAMLTAHQGEGKSAEESGATVEATAEAESEARRLTIEDNRREAGERS